VYLPAPPLKCESDRLDAIVAATMGRMAIRTYRVNARASTHG
jgi:hypothetical protein